MPNLKTTRKVLSPGDTLGIAAPASPFDIKLFNDGVAVLEGMGFRVKIPADLFERKGYLAGSDVQRAKQLMALFEDETISAIWCARGGFGSLRLLPLLDFDLISANPKPLIGFSDVTVLLATLYQRCRIITYHGPLVTTIAREPEESKEVVRALLCSSDPISLLASEPIELRPGRAIGPLAGGNLTSLCHLLGTPYMLDLDGHILFLEDRGEQPYRIDRMLTQLRIGGHLKGVAGLVLGSFADCGQVQDIHSIVQEAFSEMEGPIAAGFDFGHVTPNLTIPVGITALLDSGPGTLVMELSGDS